MDLRSSRSVSSLSGLLSIFLTSLAWAGGSPVPADILAPYIYLFEPAALESPTVGTTVPTINVNTPVVNLSGRAIDSYTGKSKVEAVIVQSDYQDFNAQATLEYVSQLYSPTFRLIGLPVRSSSGGQITTVTLFAMDAGANVSTMTFKLRYVPPSGPTPTPTPRPVPTPTPISTPSPTPAPAACEISLHEGYGARTSFGTSVVGGRGRVEVTVRNLNDSGPGSLREALSSGNRCIVFQPGLTGTITLNTNIMVNGSNITLDGFSASAPGITIKRRGLDLQGVSNVVIRGVRLRGHLGLSTSGEPAYDTLRVGGNAGSPSDGVVIDRVSLSHAIDENISIVDGSKNITLQWSIVRTATPPAKGMYTDLQSQGITVHHSLFWQNQRRNPQVNFDPSISPPSTNSVMDFINNIVWDWGANNGYYGTEVRNLATANIINNTYGDATANGSLAIATELMGQVHLSGNDFLGTASTQAASVGVFPGSPVGVLTESAHDASCRVFQKSGARQSSWANLGGLDSYGRDSLDAQAIADVATQISCP